MARKHQFHRTGLPVKMTNSGPAQLLLDCLHREGPPIEASRISRLTPDEWKDLLDLAQRQRVICLLWERFRQKKLDTAVPAETAQHLRNITLLNATHNVRLSEELNRLLAVLKPEGIPVILLKGIFLAEGVYDHIGCREMNDIDILVRTGHLEHVAAALTGMGYIPMMPIMTENTLNAHHHLPPITRTYHGSFEIHWNLVSPGQRHSIEPVELWERARPIHVSGHGALSLSPEDLLLHLCLHTSYQHRFGFGLRPFCDIAETITRFASVLKWHTVLERATRWGWQRGVYLALQLAHDMVGAPVPEDILNTLRPADATDAILATACTQVFSDKTSAPTITPPLAAFMESRHLTDKFLIAWQRVFLPKAFLAAHYSISPNSLRIYGYYLRRLFDLAVLCKPTLKKHHQNDRVVKNLADRTHHIAQWLDGTAENR